MTVLLEDGRIRRIAGDPGHLLSRGDLCAKCTLAYNGAWIDPAQRLLHPLRRAGPKGGGVFERVSWGDALGEIAARLRPLIDAGMAARILHTHYTGTCSAIAGAFPQRFFNTIGATEVDPDTICNKAGHAALDYVIGSSTRGFDPRTVKDAACVLVWGANPSASAPHVHKHWLPEAGAVRMVIDPIAHATARAADLHLQPRPGTDAALAFAMMHAAEEAGRIDRAFLSAHTIGWEAIAADVAATTPDRAEMVCGVPAGLIREAARIYAKGPSLLWLGQGLQRQRMGGNAFRAIAALAAATGNIGRRGTGLLYVNGAGTRGVDLDIVAMPDLARDPPPAISHMDLARSLEDPAVAAALFCWNNNIVASSPEQGRLRGALGREDLLHVVVDLFQTDTADHADYVLPAASFLEFDDLLFPYFHNAVAPVVKVVDPPGESLPNQEIFRRLARRLGLGAPALYEDDRSIIAALLAQAGFAGTFADLAATGTVFPSPEAGTAFDDLVFPTPSGRIEIASAQALADGHPLAPIPHADPPPAADRLRILSPASDWTMNGSYGNDGKVRRRLGPATVTLHPADAARRGFAEGTPVELFNETGTLALTVALSDTVPPGVALVPKGRWPKQDPSGANVNVLNPGDKTDMGESSAVHGVEAHIRAAAPAG